MEFSADLASFETLVEEATRLVHGARGRDYAHPSVNFKRIVDLWAVILGHEVSLRQFMWMMIAMKLARDVGTPKRDNLVDTIGYLMAYEMTEAEDGA